MTQFIIPLLQLGKLLGQLFDLAVSSSLTFLCLNSLVLVFSKLFFHPADHVAVGYFLSIIRFQGFSGQNKAVSHRNLAQRHLPYLIFFVLAVQGNLKFAVFFKDHIA